MYLITDRSCEINKNVKENFFLRVLSRFNTWAWTETSNAETDSSQIRIIGFKEYYDFIT